MVPASYAEVTVGPAERLIPVPDALSDEQAAALALQGLTAQSLATDAYRIEHGDTVLIHAGAGGVGLLLTQIAKLKGATVITTVSTADKAELSRSAGADQVLLGYDEFPSAARDLTGGAGVAGDAFECRAGGAALADAAAERGETDRETSAERDPAEVVRQTDDLDVLRVEVLRVRIDRDAVGGRGDRRDRGDDEQDGERDKRLEGLHGFAFFLVGRVKRFLERFLTGINAPRARSPC